MIKCVIIEDEPQAVTLLKNILASKFPNIEVLADFDKISVAAQFIKQHKPNFVFLDVQLNGELGIDIANHLTKEELDKLKEQREKEIDQSLVKLNNDIYQNEWRLLQNFFVPQIKLTQKTRVGSKYKRKYSKPITPYQRLLDCESITEQTKQDLLEQYKTLDPFELKKNLEKKLNQVHEIIKSTENTHKKGVS